MASRLVAASQAPLPANAHTVAARLNVAISKLAGTATGQSPSLAVAIAENGRLIYDRGFGKAKPNTRFRIASITKMFTAVSILQLVEQHRVALAASVATYLPSVPYARKITVRELLQHTSGLWNYVNAAFVDGAVRKPTTPAAILALAASHPLGFAPGTKYAYSNTGYVVLGLIVEHVTGQSLSTYEQQHIFAPAGMHDTTFGRAAPNATMAVGYMTPHGPRATAYDPSWLFADGDIVSTAADVARFDIALLGGKLISPQTFALMQQNPVETHDASGSYGLGVQISSPLGYRFVGHHGGVPGYATDNEMVPSHGLAIVVLSNSFDFITGRVNRVVLRTLLPVSPVAAIREDPAITARFRLTLLSLLEGEMDRSKFTPKVDAALTPDVLKQTVIALKPLGAVTSVKYRSMRKMRHGNAYYYDVTFADGRTMTWEFALTARGKIAAIGSTGG
ncbi:MAG: beta-lactamase family protein [Candidatus Eremiobacteraeota bacterium]|nr:beta-lactamase family protein [Candidatus Eremiobacteraeota bacterium]